MAKEKITTHRLTSLFFPIFSFLYLCEIFHLQTLASSSYKRIHLEMRGKNCVNKFIYSFQARTVKKRGAKDELNQLRGKFIYLHMLVDIARLFYITLMLQSYSSYSNCLAVIYDILSTWYYSTFEIYGSIKVQRRYLNRKG